MMMMTMMTIMTIHRMFACLYKLKYIHTHYILSRILYEFSRKKDKNHEFTSVALTRHCMLVAIFEHVQTFTEEEVLV